MKRALAALAVLLVALDVAAGQQPRPVRDPRTTGQAVVPAAITGRVTAAESGVPLRNAIVSAVGGRGVPREAVTDDRGRFELRGIEPGAWQLTVSRSGYISRKFGQSRPFGREQPIPLAAGQQVSVEIPLTRASAIVGRVFDEYGEPIAAARVAVLRSTMVRNRRYLEQVGESDSTDDTGAFRVHSLPPGEYFVTASARLAPPDSVVQTTLSPTFYPGTADFALAQKVRVTSGAEASADFALLPVRTARVSGFVTTSEGRPAEAFLSLAAETGEVGLSSGSGGITREDGTFTMADIPPGTYTLIAEIRSSPSSIAEIGSTTVTVTGADIEGISVVTAKPGTLRGTVVADTGVRRRLPEEIEIVARPRRAGAEGTFVSATGTTFELQAPPGPFTLDASVPDGWAVKSLMLGGGLDVADIAIDIGREQEVPVTVTLTDRVTDLGGIIGGAEGAGAYVVVFPADSTQWTPRRMRSTQADVRGRFRIAGLPPGERYLAVAVKELDPGQENDPDFLQQVQNKAAAFDLVAEEKRTLDLKVVQP
jgi:hypothetical protein